MSISQCDARAGSGPHATGPVSFFGGETRVPREGRGPPRGDSYSNNNMWVRTWAQIQMEASGSSPLRISDQVDRTLRALPAESWAPPLITITTRVICRRRRQLQLCELGCQ